jgi:hypothetical protein
VAHLDRPVPTVVRAFAAASAGNHTVMRGNRGA